MPSYLTGGYVPPGVFTQTIFQPATPALFNGLRIPIYIGVGQETLQQLNYELVRGSSAIVDTQVFNEDVTNNFIVSDINPAAPVLGPSGGTLTTFQVAHYPIVTGSGQGVVSTNPANVSVTVVSSPGATPTPVGVAQVIGVSGQITLTDPPLAGSQVLATYFFKRTDTKITDNVSAQANGTANVFQVSEFPITDGTNSGTTTTTPTDVTATVNGTQVVATAVDGTNGLVTLTSAPSSGAQVLIVHYFNTWQNTFDYLKNTDITSVQQCGLSPNRSDFFQGPDFNIFGSEIHWGASDTINPGIINTGTTAFSSSQVSVTLVDNNIYLEQATPFVNNAVIPPVTSRTQFVLNHIPTLGNGLNNPLGQALYNTLANGRIDVTSDRPDLVTVFVGQSIQDAISRPPVTVATVNGAKQIITLAAPIPLNTKVYVNYYYSNLVDDVYTLACVTPAAVGQYTVTSGVLGPLYGLVYDNLGIAITKFALPQTLGWPSNIEQLPDVIHFGGKPVAETVTVTITSLAATGAKLQNSIPGPWTISGSNQTFQYAYYNGTGVESASVTLPLSTAPSITGTVAGPFTFGVGAVLVVTVNGGAPQSFNLVGTGLSAATVAANIILQNPVGFTPSAGGVGNAYLVLTGTALGQSSTLQVPVIQTTLGFSVTSPQAGVSTTATQAVNTINEASDVPVPAEAYGTANGVLTTFTHTTVHIPVAPGSVTILDNPEFTSPSFGTAAPSTTLGPTVLANVPVVPFTVTIFDGTHIIATDNGLGVLAGTDNAAAVTGTITYSTGSTTIIFGAGAVFGGAVTVQYAQAVQTAVATDNGFGVITGVGVTGTINYTNGHISVTFTTAPYGQVSGGNAITTNYTYELGTSTLASLLTVPVTSEGVASGNGINPAFSYSVLNVPVVPNTVTVTAGSVVGTDNGLGIIAGAGVAGTINYTSGAVALTYTLPPPAIGTAITISYTYTSQTTFQLNTASLTPTVTGQAAFITITGGTSLATIGFEVNQTDTGAAATPGYTVSSTNLTAGSSGTGVVGQTYTDARTGLRFSLLKSPFGGSYSSGGTFSFTLGLTLTTNSSLPSLVIPGAQTTVTSLIGLGIGNICVVNTYAPSGNEPAVSDFYYLTYNYEKTDFTPALYTQFKHILADFGPLIATNSLTLAAYLAIQNGAVAVALSQVLKVPGTNQAADQSYINAIDALSTPLATGTKPAVYVPLTTSSTVITFLAQNAQIQSSIRYQNEQIGMFGFANGTTPQVAQAFAESLSNNRMIAVYPDSVILQLVDQFGNTSDAVLDGSFLAAAVAGANVSPAFDVASPMTNRSIVGFKTLGRVMDIVDQNQTAAAGITVLVNLQPNIVIRQFLTTDMSNILTKEPTVTTISDFVQISLRNALRQFIGVKFLPSVLQDIANIVGNTLKTLVAAEIISGYTGISVTPDPSDPTSALIEAFYSPIFPLNYIVVTLTLQSTIA